MWHIVSFKDMQTMCNECVDRIERNIVHLLHEHQTSFTLPTTVK